MESKHWQTIWNIYKGNIYLTLICTRVWVKGSKKKTKSSVAVVAHDHKTWIITSVSKVIQNAASVRDEPVIQGLVACWRCSQHHSIRAHTSLHFISGACKHTDTHTETYTRKCHSRWVMGTCLHHDFVPIFKVSIKKCNICDKCSEKLFARRNVIAYEMRTLWDTHTHVSVL